MVKKASVTPEYVSKNTAMYSFVFMLAFSLINCLFLVERAGSFELPNDIEEQVSRCRADDIETWSYRGENNGPHVWAETYPECHGLRQSPIKIDSTKAIHDRSLGKLYFNYFRVIDKPTIINNGHTIRVIPDNIWRSVYVNRSTYYLQEIHFHWGSVKEVGSEHIIDGVQYPMEMHLVHKNRENATTVVAVLFEEDEGMNAELQHIVNEFPKVMYRGSMIRMPFRLDVWNLVPENPASFYRYEGSLTTPECTEGIIWSVLKTRAFVSRAQMREFRKLFSSPQNITTNGCRISNNFRPVQHLHRRSIFTSW